MKPRTLLSSLFVTLSFVLLASGLRAQTITYTDGQTDPTDYSNPPSLSTFLFIESGAARQTGVLSGADGYNKIGAGKLSLSGVNTFTGGLVVYGGTLNIFNDSNLGASANQIQLAAPGTTLQTSSTYSSHTLDVANNGTIDVAQNFTTLQNAGLTGGGTLTKTGGGTFFLGAGAGNGFGGQLILATNGGTFTVGSSVSSSPAGGATFTPGSITVNRGATFRIEDNGTNSSTGYIADRLGSGPFVTMNGGTFNLNGANNAAVMTQTVGPLFLSSGASTINVTRNTAGTPELVFATLGRNSGAFVNFTGTSLGTGTNDARILSSGGIGAIYPLLVNNGGTAGLVGGGGASGSTTMSILTGARSGNDLVTYGANGLRPLVAGEYNAVAGNNINGAGATDNVKISNATPTTFVALSGPKTINALVVTAAVTGTETWAMGNTLTLTSGQFIHSTANALNISSGVLTAGTGAPGSIDLDITNPSTSVTIGANINDNGFTSVALVKNGANTLILSNATDSNYSGGTFINEGTLATGNTANRRYLGTGAVVVNASAFLSLGNRGATSFVGSPASPTYTAKTGSTIYLQNSYTHSGVVDYFNIESGAIFRSDNPTVSAGMDLDVNLNAAPGAILLQTSAGANVAIKKGGVSIQTALTTPTYYFGANSPQNEDLTVGAGTPWLGLSTGTGLGSGYGSASATNNTLTANSDFTLQSFLTTAGAASPLALGAGASATNIVKILTPNGNVNVNIVGSATLNQDNSQYGSAGSTVTFQVTPGATLLASTATAMGVVGGAATAPASIVVQNGGTLTIGNAAAINGNVTLQPGGMFTQNQATLTGTGTFTHSNGSILNLTTSTASVSGATQALGTVPGTIVRMGISGLLPGTSTAGVTQFDSRLNDAAVYELTTGVIMGNASGVLDSLFTLSASGGIGGVLTNNAFSLTLGAATGKLVIGAGGGTFAATTGTTLTVTQGFTLGTNTLTIGSAQSYDGNPKLGTVLINAGLGNSGSAGSIISVLNGATLRLGASSSIPSATRLTVNTGGTFNLSGFANTIESLTGGGTVTNTGGANTLTLAPTTTDADFSGNLTATTPANLALIKSGSGKQTLSGPSTYGGATTVSQGTLEVTANDALGSNAAGTSVTSGAALQLNNVNYSTAEAVSISGTGISNGGALVNSGTSTFAGQVTAATNASINAGGGTLSLTGGLVKDGTTLTLTGGGRINVSGTGISGTSANSDLVVDGTTVVVSAASNYNGPTTVQNSGTLVANAQIDNTSMTVSSNSMLSGTGKVVAASGSLITINGALVVGDSTLGSPVASTLDLETSGAGSAVLAATSKFYIDLFANAGDNTGNTAAADRLRLFGTLTIDSLAQLYINDSTGSMAFSWSDKWIIGDLTGGTLASTYTDANINGPTLGSGWFWHIEQVGNDLQLMVVPEPSRALLLMVGMTGMALRRRRVKDWPEA